MEGFEKKALGLVSSGESLVKERAQRGETSST